MKKKVVAGVLFTAVLLFAAAAVSFRTASPIKINHADTTLKTYLALGDSYTIGESVAAAENYPNQLVAALRHNGIKMNDAEIRAVTGWTTGDLINSLRTTPPAAAKYNLVTLLIGVNNQFQGRTITEYEIEFKYLLDEAIQFAGDKKNVIVISIPDYSVTPFAAGGETAMIARDIDEFNALQKKISLENGVSFINITGISRKGKHDAGMQAPDGLHPAGKQYAKWVKVLLPEAKRVMNN